MWTVEERAWVEVAQEEVTKATAAARAGGRTDGQATRAKARAVDELRKRQAVAGVRAERVTAGGYADDLLAVTNTAEGMELVGWVVSTLGGFASLVLAHAKTEYLVAPPRKAAAGRSEEAHLFTD